MSIIEYSQNIADAEAPQPLPVGEYSGHCTAAVASVAKSSGNPVLVLTLRIPRSEFPADFEPGEGVDDITLTVNNLTTRDIPSDRWRMRKYCEAFGVPMSKQIDPNDFVGRDVRIKTKMGKDLEGNNRTEIDQILRA